MNRITPTMVLEAYKKLGATVRQHGFGLPKSCCGLGAVCYARGGNFNKWIDEEYNDRYINGFVRGFDGCNMINGLGKEWKQGHKDGKASYKLVSEKL